MNISGREEAWFGFKRAPSIPGMFEWATGAAAGSKSLSCRVKKQQVGWKKAKAKRKAAKKARKRNRG